MNLREIIERDKEAERKKRGLICKGLYFRGYSSLYTDGLGKVERKEGVRLLKKKSCKRWEKCDSYEAESNDMRCDWWMIDDMKEMIDCDDGLIMSEIEDGALYVLRMTNVETDWETGFVDGYNFELIKVEENG